MAVRGIWLMGKFSQKGNCHQTVDHISRTLNQFKLHQYLISLLRKTQNTFLEPAVSLIWQMGYFPKKEISHQIFYIIIHVDSLCHLMAS